MTRPLSRARLQTPTEWWVDMVVDYKMQNGCRVMTLQLKTGRVRFQLAPDGMWRRHIKRRGCNYWRRAIPWDALQCRLAYNSYCDVFPKAPRVVLSDTAKRGRPASPP